MKDNIKSARRRMLKLGGAALAMIPLMALTGRTYAATNAAMRAAFKYQNKPDGDKACRGCVQFVPGKTAKALGGCKIYPGDTATTPTGHCTACTAAPRE